MKSRRLAKEGAGSERHPLQPLHPTGHLPGHLVSDTAGCRRVLLPGHGCRHLPLHRCAGAVDASHATDHKMEDGLTIYQSHLA